VDPRRFDALARSLAAPKTRRGLLGTLGRLAALGAGLAGARNVEAQVTQTQCGNVTCGTNPGRCAPGCVCCTYANGNNRCMPPAKCTGTILTTTTTTTTTTAPPCATGYERVNGVCFEISNDRPCTNQSDDCFSQGSVDGSFNYLCATSHYDHECSTNAQCPAGEACQQADGSCISPC